MEEEEEELSLFGSIDRNIECPAEPLVGDLQGGTVRWMTRRHYHSGYSLTILFSS